MNFIIMQVKLDMHVRERVQKKVTSRQIPVDSCCIIVHRRGIPIDEQILNKWSECHQACTVPLQEQGIFNQMTVFLTIVAGKGGGGNHHGSTNDGI